ncbi:MAG: hypothetical protein AAGJ35_01390 [Myxococcota bacterium]
MCAWCSSPPPKLGPQQIPTWTLHLPHLKQTFHVPAVSIHIQPKFAKQRQFIHRDDPETHATPLQLDINMPQPSIEWRKAFGPPTFSFSNLWMFLLGFSGILSFVCGIWVLRRNTPIPNTEQQPRSPYLHAKAQLEQISCTSEYTFRKHKKTLQRIIHILRIYLQQRFMWPCRTSTLSELQHFLQTQPMLPQILPELFTWFQQRNFQRFSNNPLLPQDIHTHQQRALDFLEQLESWKRQQEQESVV